MYKYILINRTIRRFVLTPFIHIFVLCSAVYFTDFGTILKYLRYVVNHIVVNWWISGHRDPIPLLYQGALPSCFRFLVLA